MLTNFNSSVEFAICSRIPLGEGWYDIESSPLTCNLLTCLVGDFSGGYSQTDYNFNFNINVKVTVDIYVNSSINFSVSHLPKYLLAFRIMKLESTSKITAQFETIPQCLLFFSLFFYICLRNKHDMRLRYFLIAFLYFYSLTGLSSPWCTFIKLKACHQIHFFTLDFIYTCNELVSSHSSLSCKFHTTSKFKRKNNKSFHHILLILSGDISLNPGPVYNSQSSCSNEWNVFKAKGIHLIHLNVNSLLPKIDEIRYIAAHTNATVIGISESKLDETILQSEIQISNYELLRCDRNRTLEVLLAILEVISVTYKNTFFRRKLKNFLLKLFYLKPNLKLLELFIDLLIKVTLLKSYMQTLTN